MRTSAKRSGIENHTFFLDKCLGTIDVRTALIGLGANTEILVDHFDQDATDPDWIKEVGRRGWIILSKDRHLRSNALEVLALIESGTAAFLLTGAQMTGPKMASAFVAAMPAMLKFLSKFQRPFIASVTDAGRVRYLDNYSSLHKRGL